VQSCIAAAHTRRSRWKSTSRRNRPTPWNPGGAKATDEVEEGRRMARKSIPTVLPRVAFLSFISWATLSHDECVHPQTVEDTSRHPIDAPLTVSANPHYFQDSRGTAMTL